MITLKTDYKDAVLDIMQNTLRKFSQTDNDDGTISLTDETVYSQKGDAFAAIDINNTNKAIKEIREVRTASVPSSGWSSSAPHTQTIEVEGITEDDEPTISLYLAGSPSSENVKAMNKAYGMLDRAVTGDGTITLYCYNKKPATTYTIAIKGV